MKRHRTTLKTILRPLALTLLGLLVALPLAAGDKGEHEHGDHEKMKHHESHMKDSNDDPYAKANNAWIDLSGTVRSVSADSFLLDYGDGLVTVEMDDGDRDADAYKLLEGDKVTVSGMIDDDFFETTTIEAASVYVEKLGTHFFASAIDDEDRKLTVYTPVVLSRYTVTGTVVDVRDEELTLDTGRNLLTVEVEEMPYNPLDDEGYQKIREGDRISVTGEIDTDLFEGRELVADTIVTHHDA